jgi:hypothetical protein
VLPERREEDDMTKIWVISDYQRDLNREGGFFFPDGGIPDADVLVVAGDFHPPLHSSVLALAKVAKHIPIIYVPGNRDYYGVDTIEREIDLARSAAATSMPFAKGFYILDNEDVVVEGVRFVGATLWTDLQFDGGPAPEAILRLNDFRAIAVSDNGTGRTAREAGSFAFTPEEYARRHAVSRRFIEDTLAVPFEGPTVVVSHHSPHGNSVGERFADNVHGANALFHSDLTDILEGPSAPDMWIHGATHVGVDYRVGSTRVMSNPYGYRHNDENPDFVSDLVVDPEEPDYAPAY